VRRVATAVGRFLYDLVVGDDWKVAVVVPAGLVIAAVVAAVVSPVVATVIGALALGAGFAAALLVDVRRSGG
jgi:hypothetical protein